MVCYYSGRRSSQKNRVGASEEAEATSGLRLTQLRVSSCIGIRAL